jgi:hypothetical protein
MDDPRKPKRKQQVDQRDRLVRDMRNPNFYNRGNIPSGGPVQPVQRPDQIVFEIKKVTPAKKIVPKTPPKTLQKKEPIIVEPIPTRQPPVTTFAPSEIVAPIVRPVQVPPMPPPLELNEERPVAALPVERKLPKAVMPRNPGGWGRQPILMRVFPSLYEK